MAGPVDLVDEFTRELGRRTLSPDARLLVHRLLDAAFYRAQSEEGSAREEEEPWSRRDMSRLERFYVRSGSNVTETPIPLLRAVWTLSAAVRHVVKSGDEVRPQHVEVAMRGLCPLWPIC